MLVESVEMMDLELNREFNLYFEVGHFIKLYSHSPRSTDVFIVTQLTIKHCDEDRYEASFTYVNDADVDAEPFRGAVNGFNHYKVEDDTIHLYSQDYPLHTNKT